MLSSQNRLLKLNKLKLSSQIIEPVSEEIFLNSILWLVSDAIKIAVFKLVSDESIIILLIWELSNNTDNSLFEVSVDRWA